MFNKYGRLLVTTSIVAASLILSGCGSDDDISALVGSDGDSNALLTKAANSYADFKSGIISADTLASYVDDWNANRPEGSNGRLVIFQAGATSNAKFITSKSDDVVVYQIPAGGACDPSYLRHDGVANVPGALLSGQYVDGMINMFHLDPENDYVVFAVGVGSTSMREVVRSYWVLAYWGWAKNRLAFLDGSVDYGFSETSGLSTYLGATANMPPAAPSDYSMKTAPIDRTHLQIYIKEMMEIASLEDQSGYFIVDARGSDEYNGVVEPRTADKNCGPNLDEQCYNPFKGHIRGAVDFSYKEILVRDDQTTDINGDGNITSDDASFRFKSPADLEALYAEKGYQKGDKVITYCRTGRKSTLAAITAYSVLDYDIAMYDGSWIQWGQMANRTDVEGQEILPADSKWVTDSNKYSVNLGYVDPQYTQSATPYAINLDATDSLEIQKEDQEYLK